MRTFFSSNAKRVPIKGFMAFYQLPERDFDAYIFDCDGTLADTMGLHYEAWKLALKPYGAELSEDLYYAWGGRPTREIVEALNEMQGLAMNEENLVILKEDLYHGLISHVQPIESVVALARSMYGKKPMAVASGGGRVSVQKTLASLGLLELFVTVVTSEDYKYGKPAPDPYLEAARRLQVAPAQCLAFEDTEIGSQSARAAGMECVLVDSRRGAVLSSSSTKQ
jgi:HAD superfamily hydrolase (TIGR01509 family)